MRRGGVVQEGLVHVISRKLFVDNLLFTFFVLTASEFYLNLRHSVVIIAVASALIKIDLFLVWLRDSHSFIAGQVRDNKYVGERIKVGLRHVQSPVVSVDVDLLEYVVLDGR